MTNQILEKALELACKEISRLDAKLDASAVRTPYYLMKYYLKKVKDATRDICKT